MKTPNQTIESTKKAPDSNRTNKQLSVNSIMLLQDSSGRKSHACNQNANAAFGHLNLIQAAARHRIPFLQDFDLMIDQTDVPRYLKKHEATLKFPEKLLLLIVQAEREASGDGRDPSMACLAWTQNGNAIVLRNTTELHHKILPLAGCQAKFLSFTRKLYRWGFRQVVDSNERNTINVDQKVKVFQHPFFQRGNTPLMARMKSITAEATRRALSAQKLGEHQDGNKTDRLEAVGGFGAVNEKYLAPRAGAAMYSTHPDRTECSDRLLSCQNNPAFQDSVWSMFCHAVAERAGSTRQPPLSPAEPFSGPPPPFPTPYNFYPFQTLMCPDPGFRGPMRTWPTTSVWHSIPKYQESFSAVSDGAAADSS